METAPPGMRRPLIPANICSRERPVWQSGSSCVVVSPGCNTPGWTAQSSPRWGRPWLRRPRPTWRSWRLCRWWSCDPPAASRPGWRADAGTEYLHQWFYHFILSLYQVVTLPIIGLLFGSAREKERELIRREMAKIISFMLNILKMYRLALFL